MVINNQVVISIKGLSHTYEKWGTVIHALRDVTVDFHRGKWTMVVGPNGAGKSTLLHILGGEVAGKSFGKVYFNSRDLLQGNYLNRAKYFATIQQDPGLNTVPELTIAEHFALFPTNHATWIRPINNALQKTISDLLQPFGLYERVNLPVGLLSGGERQILAFLLARLRKVDVLLLDEPIGALDSNNALSCLNEISKAVLEGITVLMVTHDLNVACKYADRMIGLARGRIVLDLKDSEVKESDPFEIWKTLQRESHDGI